MDLTVKKWAWTGLGREELITVIPVPGREELIAVNLVPLQQAPVHQQCPQGLIQVRRDQPNLKEDFPEVFGDQTGNNVFAAPGQTPPLEPQTSVHGRTSTSGNPYDSCERIERAQSGSFSASYTSDGGMLPSELQ